MTFTTRFAPSPTGPLHLGHAYSAILAHDMARAANGRFLLRIEDIDNTRSRPAWEDAIYDDLRWLGLTWDTPPMRQSERNAAYAAALHMLWEQKLLFSCTCRRKDILEALGAPQEGDRHAHGPDGLIYPGTCRNRSDRTGPFPENTALRIDMARALGAIEAGPISFTECGVPSNGTPRDFAFDANALPKSLGDIVLSRHDFTGSYHLSVVLDDAAQGVTHVVRGEDLFDATKIHVVLQKLLGLKTPVYHHHALIRDAAGKRLAKRDDARAIAKYRAEGATPADIRAAVGL